MPASKYSCLIPRSRGMWGLRAHLAKTETKRRTAQACIRIAAPGIGSPDKLKRWMEMGLAREGSCDKGMGQTYLTDVLSFFLNFQHVWEQGSLHRFFHQIPTSPKELFNHRCKSSNCRPCALVLEGPRTF